MSNKRNNTMFPAGTRVEKVDQNLLGQRIVLSGTVIGPGSFSNEILVRWDGEEFATRTVDVEHVRRTWLADDFQKELPAAEQKRILGIGARANGGRS